MTIDTITFVVIKDIYDYHDYSAFGFVAKAIIIEYSTTIAIMACVFFDYIYIIIIIIYNYKIMIIRFISLCVIQLMVDMCHYLTYVT